MPGLGKETIADLAAFLDLDTTSFSGKLLQAKIGMVTAAEDMALPIGKIKDLLKSLQSELGPTTTANIFSQFGGSTQNIEDVKAVIRSVADLKEQTRQLNDLKAQGLQGDQLAGSIRGRLFADQERFLEDTRKLTLQTQQERANGDAMASQVQARFVADQIGRLEELRVRESQTEADRRQAAQEFQRSVDQRIADTRRLRQEEEAAQRAADQQVRNQISGIRSLGSDLRSIGGLLSVTVTAPLVALAGFALKAQSDVQSATIAFKQLTGSESEALKTVQQLRDISTSTPLQFEAIVTATKRMVALGFTTQEAVANLRGIGGAASIMGLGAQGIERISKAIADMKAKGTVQAEEMRQLANAGIPGWELLAKVLDTTVKDAMERVKKRAVDSATFVPQLLGEINTRYGSVLTEMANTTAGQFEIMKNRLTFAMQDLGVALAPIATVLLKEFAQPAIEGISSLAKGFADLSKPLQLVIIGFAGMAALSGPVLYFTGSLVTSLASMLDIMVKLGGVDMARGALRLLVGGGAVAGVGALSLGVGAAIGLSQLSEDTKSLRVLDVAFDAFLQKQVTGAKSLWEVKLQLKQALDYEVISQSQYNNLLAQVVEREKELEKVERSRLGIDWQGAIGVQLGSLRQLREAFGLQVDKTKEMTAEEALATLGIKKDTEARKEAYTKALEAYKTLQKAGEGPDVLREALSAVNKAWEAVDGSANKVAKSFKAIPLAEKGVDGAYLAGIVRELHTAWEKYNDDLVKTGAPTRAAAEAALTLKRELDWREKLEKAGLSLQEDLTKPLHEFTKEAEDAIKKVKAILGEDPMVVQFRKDEDAMKLLGVTSRTSIGELNDALATTFDLFEQNAIDATQWTVANKNYLEQKAKLGLATKGELIALKQYEDNLSGAFRTAMKDVKTLGDEMEASTRRAFTGIEGAIAKNIIHWKGFKEAVVNIASEMGQDFLKVMLKGLFKPLEDEMAKSAKKLGDWLGKILHIGGGPAASGGGTLGTIGSIPAGGGIPNDVWSKIGLGQPNPAPPTGGVAGGAGGAVGQAAGSALSGWIGAISGAVTAVSSVVGNFQMAGMNKSLDLIVNHTLRIFNETFNLRNDEWSRYGGLLHKLDDMWNSIRDIKGGGSGNTFYIQGITDLDALVRQLKARGVTIVGG